MSIATSMHAASLSAPRRSTGRSARRRTYAHPSRVEMQETVRHTATLMGVNPRLAMAIAYIESGFESGKVSEAGALGVMQIVPEAAEWASLLAGRELDPRDPNENVVAGIAILRYMLRHTDSVHDAIAAYCQGLVSVRESGPLPSTQSYVARVLRAAHSL